MTLPPVKPEQDPQLAAAWRDASDELPPAPLDSTILAAAHRAVDSGPRDSQKPDVALRNARRWRIPLAAAASICVVALGILLTRPEQAVVSTLSVNAPPSTSAAPPPATSPTEQATAPAAASAKAPARRNEATQTADGASASATLAAGENAQSAVKKTSDDRRELASAPAASVAREAEAPRVADKAELFKQSESRATASLSGAVVDQGVARGAAGAVVPVDAAAAIARIRQLHAEGKFAPAAQKLRALRVVDPEADQQLPVELRAWAATVKP
jgi:hypothetical protein